MAVLLGPSSGAPPGVFAGGSWVPLEFRHTSPKSSVVVHYNTSLAQAFFPFFATGQAAIPYLL